MHVLKVGEKTEAAVSNSFSAQTFQHVTDLEEAHTRFLDACQRLCFLAKGQAGEYCHIAATLGACLETAETILSNR